MNTTPARTLGSLLSRALARQVWLLAACSVAVAVVAGCGGGVGTGGTGGDASASFASGPISGFGSIIVGGVRFDDSSAAIEDGEGTRKTRDDLRLGMTVDIDSGAISSDGSGSRATATRIRVDSELVGLVGVVSPAASAFTMLGQVVQVDAATVFDERLTGGLAGLVTGQPVEVYAVFDAQNNRYRATRVEPSTLLAGLRLRGPVSQLDTAAQTLRVGGQDYSYAGAGSVPAGLAVGQYVRLRLTLLAAPTPRWVVQSFGTALPALADVDGARLEGLISSFSTIAAFGVNGRPVDASGASFPNGAAGLAIGARVEVEGVLRGGVLRATKVQLVSDDDVRQRFELTALITAVDTRAGTITLRGVTVSTTRSDLVYQDGTAANLAVGRLVEVRGVLSADRRVLEATRIRFR